jgi:hypothetical protein
MTPGAQPEAVAESADLLPPHLREKFERISREIEVDYGSSPGAATLARLWLACGTDEQVREEFDRAVTGCDQRPFRPNAEGKFNDESL